MASIVYIIPPVCTCGTLIGRLQYKYENYLKTMEFPEAILATFGGDEPKMCCRRHFAGPQMHIPDHSFDTRVSDGEKFIYKETQPKYNPTNPYPET